MKKAARLAACVCVLGFAAGLGGCVAEEKGHLRKQIAAEIEAVTDGTVLSFELADDHGNPNRVQLGSPEGRGVVSSADLAAAIGVFDSHKEDRRILGNGGPALELSGPEPATTGVIMAVWEHPDGSSDWALTSINGALVYGPWMCQLPTLRQLRTAAPGSDFGRAGECSPALEYLDIISWDLSSGHKGLGDLENLRSLLIGGILTDPRILPALDGLEELWLPAEANTPENRTYLEDRYPGCDVKFSGTAPSVEAGQ
jgi:hypothetical protein